MFYEKQKRQINMFLFYFYVVIKAIGDGAHFVAVFHRSILLLQTDITNSNITRITSKMSGCAQDQLMISDLRTGEITHKEL